MVLRSLDLMIGDWVKIKTYGVSDKYERTEAYIYVKVAEIGSGLITVEYNNDIKEPYRICENKEIEPILLTPEILEKNGFEKVYDKYQLPNYRIKWNSYTDLFFTVFTGVDGYWNHVGLGVIIGGVPATLDYVHQLQHALRLCEIEKEIIL